MKGIEGLHSALRLALLSDSHSFLEENPNSEILDDYAVDTEKGIRLLKEGSDYLGSCELSKMFIICVDDRNYNYMTQLHDEDLGFMAKLDSGNCSEI